MVNIFISFINEMISMISIPWVGGLEKLAMGRNPGLVYFSLDFTIVV
jgi:hypothetical protein